MLYKFLTIQLITFFCCKYLSLGQGTDENADTLKHYKLSQINIVESRTKVFEEIPGSAIVINYEILDIKPNTYSDILTRYPGIHISNEDGLGLRLNLGIRGLESDRSRSLLVMEDGIPVALAPYGEPEMYYTPNIDRVKGIEILKGSGSILYGPQTIGGVLNLITNEPSFGTNYFINLSGGTGAYLKSRIGYSIGDRNIGFLIEYHRKQADNFFPVHYKINDLMTKFRVNLSDRSNLNFKVGFYDENSNSTYIGITQKMYDRGEYFVNLAPNDNLDIRRYSVSLIHNLVLNDKMIFTTSAFGYSTARNWTRQEFSRKPSSNQTGVIYGDTSVTNGALYMLNSTGGRNRQFEVFGIEPRFEMNYQFFSLNNELKAGFRFLYEKAFEQMIIGNKYNAISGQMRDNETRTGQAISAYLQNRIFLDENLIITPGLRIENFYYDRRIDRLKNVDTLIENNNYITALIPGIGVNYNLYSETTIFAGIHKGFAPPRIKDAITNQGEAIELNPEDSWNIEIGLRSHYFNWLNFEITLYMLDFSNQIIPVSQSSGGSGTGLVNGGKTLHKGIESSFNINISHILELPYYLSFGAHFTLSNSIYSADRFIDFENSKVNIINNSLPYAPNFKWSCNLNFRTNWGLSLELSSIYTGKQFTDQLNSLSPSNDGLIGIIDGYNLLNFSGKYSFIDSKIALNFKVNNILDLRYISSRRPQGIKVGLPRIITAGIDFNL